jgi:hypothetical protein
MATRMDEDPADPADTPGPDGDAADPVRTGIDQFQRAALEAIRAGRAMLDAAESILQDPAAADAVVRSVGTVARNATEAVAGFATGRWPAPGTASGDDHDDEPDEDPPDGFERISVS